MSRMRIILGFTILVQLVACGSNEPAYTPTEDKVETTGKIQFDTSAELIRVVQAGLPAKGTIIESCEIAFESSELTYSYSEARSLELAGKTMSFIREVDGEQAVPGVPDGLFGVWALPAVLSAGTTFQIEVEIRAKTMTYRNFCSR